MWNFNNITGFGEWAPILMGVVAAIINFVYASYLSRANVSNRESRTSNSVLFGIGCLVFTAFCVWFFGRGNAVASVACANCGSDIVGKFCSECGSAAETIAHCIECGVEAVGKFCSNCGAALK